MRILHTADWHLGHSLHRFRREREHAAFMEWLLDALVEHSVDALLIAGDVFDTANPPSSALRAWYAFLARARARVPDLDIVVIGGNHDSAARLDAPRPLLEVAGVSVIGGLPVDDAGELVASDLVVPIRGASGAVAAQVIAMPFLRLSDLPAGLAPADGVRARYEAAAQVARERLEPGQAIVAMGHAYLTGTAVSELSERKVLGGNQHALPTAVFPPDAAYVALGHMHLAQQVTDGVHYPGSPLPLSFGERTYTHQVLLVDLDGDALSAVTPLHVPRAVDLLAIPDERDADGADGADGLPLDQALDRIAALPDAVADEDPDASAAPFLEVRVRLEGPLPGLRQRIEEAVADRHARLVRIGTAYTGSGRPLAEGPVAGRTLSDLSPEEVLRERWARDYQGQPDRPLLDAFHEVLDLAHQHDGADA